MTQKWFVSQGDRVYGPWSQDDVLSHRSQGNIFDQDLIWAEGERTWVTIKIWQPRSARTAQPAAVVRPTNVPAADAAETKLVHRVQPAAETAVTLVAAQEEPASVFVARDDEATVVTRRTADDAATVFSPAANETWHFAVDGKSHGPFNRPNLLVELRRLPSVEGVVLWTRGMREWAGIYEFHEIALEIGVSQRKFARAKISGRAVLKIDGLTQVAPLASISEGGLGLSLTSEYFAGQPVTVEIQADALGAPVTLDAEVRYCAQGIVGLKFIAPSSAIRGRIANLVKRLPTARAA